MAPLPPLVLIRILSTRYQIMAFPLDNSKYFANYFELCTLIRTFAAAIQKNELYESGTGVSHHPFF